MLSLHLDYQQSSIITDITLRDAMNKSFLSKEDTWAMLQMDPHPILEAVNKMAYMVDNHCKPCKPFC
jgi:hypothetical protein